MPFVVVWQRDRSLIKGEENNDADNQNRDRL